MTELALAQTAAGPHSAQPFSASPAASYYEHAGRIIEMQGESVRVLAELGQVEVIPRFAGHLDLPPVLRRSVRGPVLDHHRLDLVTLSTGLRQTTRVSLSMIAQVVSGGRPVPGVSYDQACSLTRHHLISAGEREMADSLLNGEADFSHGELAAVLRSPWLLRFPAWARTYDAASGRVKFLPGDEQSARHLSQVLALREVLGGEALATGTRRLLSMRVTQTLPVRASTVSQLAAPLRLLLAARGGQAVLELLDRSEALSHAADDAVSLIREDLAEGGAAHDRLQVAAQGLARNPSRRAVLISGGIADLHLSRAGARLLLPGSPESLASMQRGEPRLITDGNDFRDAPPVAQIRNLIIREGLMCLRFSQIRLQGGTVHHDDLNFTLERLTSGGHRLSTLNLIKPERPPKIRTVQVTWGTWRHLGRPFAELTPVEKNQYLHCESDDLPF